MIILSNFEYGTEELPTRRVPLTHIDLAFIVIYYSSLGIISIPLIKKLFIAGGFTLRITFHSEGIVTSYP